MGEDSDAIDDLHPPLAYVFALEADGLESGLQFLHPALGHGVEPPRLVSEIAVEAAPSDIRPLDDAVGIRRCEAFIRRARRDGLDDLLACLLAALLIAPRLGL